LLGSRVKFSPTTVVVLKI